MENQKRNIVIAKNQLNHAKEEKNAAEVEVKSSKEELESVKAELKRAQDECIRLDIRLDNSIDKLYALVLTKSRQTSLQAANTKAQRDLLEQQSKMIKIMYCDMENCKEAKKALETDKEELKKNVQHVEARLKKKKTCQAGEKKCRNLHP